MINYLSLGLKMPRPGLKTPAFFSGKMDPTGLITPLSSFFSSRDNPRTKYSTHSMVFFCRLLLFSLIFHLWDWTARNHGQGTVWFWRSRPSGSDSLERPALVEAVRMERGSPQAGEGGQTWGQDASLPRVFVCLWLPGLWVLFSSIFFKQPFFKMRVWWGREHG